MPAEIFGHRFLNIASSFCFDTLDKITVIRHSKAVLRLSMCFFEQYVLPCIGGRAKRTGKHSFLERQTHCIIV